MDSKDSIASALENLIRLSSEKGFLIFDDIHDEADRMNLTIKDVTYLSDSITTQGILVYDEAPVTSVDDSHLDDDYDDYAHRDYDDVFNKVVELDPELEDFINIVRAIVPPQAHEMDHLKYQVCEGNMYARDRVIQMHLRFAVRIALQRAETFDTDIADTIQDACIGLIKAVDKYYPDSNTKFGSYASLWIFQYLGRLQANQRPTVYYPAHKKDGYFTMYPILKENYDLDSSIWKDPNARRLIKTRLNCADDMAEDIINQSMPIESLDLYYEMFFENNEIDEIQDEGLESDIENDIWNSDLRSINTEVFYWHDNIFDKIEQIDLKAAIEDALAELSNREQEVIKARYGFEDGIEKTLEEIGQTFGVTRERIRQIEKKAMRKLSRKRTLRKLKAFL